jgi:CheY-like chemotaxis protein
MQRPNETDRPLKGMRILVAEDEILIAADLEDTFREAGAEILSAATLGEALRGAADMSLTAAVLDARLGGDTTEAVADSLARRGIPFFFYSGFGLPDSMRQKFPDRPLLLKPARPSAFVATLLEVLTAHR